MWLYVICNHSVLYQVAISIKDCVVVQQCNRYNRKQHTHQVPTFESDPREGEGIINIIHRRPGDIASNTYR